MPRRPARACSSVIVVAFVFVGTVIAMLGRPAAALRAAARSSTTSTAFVVAPSAPRVHSRYEHQQQPRRWMAAAAASATDAANAASAAAPPAVANEEFDIPPFTPTPATEGDLRCIEERQLCHQVTCAGGPRERCKHGFPQAFVFHPSKTTFNSGLFRLTCPLLVKAVDEYEAQGGITEFNYRMERSPEMQREFRRVNARHSSIRRGLVEPGHLDPYLARLGPGAVEQILASGIAGVSPHKTEDLKCLHAHLADYLCTKDNMIGKEVYEHLRDKRGIAVDGCDRCWQQCDSTHERTEDSWWYTPIKNKQKLRSRYERRTARKARDRQREQQQEQQHGEAAGDQQQQPPPPAP